MSSRRFFRSESGSDLRVRIADDETIPVHSTILSLWSEKWQIILSPDREGPETKELVTREIDLRGRPDALLFVEAIYSLPDDVEVTKDTMFALFRVAHEHRCHQIMRKCAEFCESLLRIPDAVRAHEVLNEWAVFGSDRVLDEVTATATAAVGKDVTKLSLEALEVVVKRLSKLPYDALKQITAWVVSREPRDAPPDELTAEQAAACRYLILVDWDRFPRSRVAAAYLELLRDPGVPRKYLSELRHVFFEVLISDTADKKDKRVLFEYPRKRKRSA